MADQITAEQIKADQIKLEVDEYDDAIHEVTATFRTNNAEMHYGVKQCWSQAATSAKAVPATTVAHKQHEEDEAIAYKTELDKVTLDFNERYPESVFWYTGAQVRTIPPQKGMKPSKAPAHPTAVYKAPPKQ